MVGSHEVIGQSSVKIEKSQNIPQISGKDMTNATCQLCHDLQLIVWLLSVTVCAAGAKKREISYNVLGEGQKIFGKIGAEYTAKSSQECSLRYVQSYWKHFLSCT